MKKRILSICLALVMVLGLTPVVIAESGTGWSYSGGKLEIKADGYNPEDFASFASSVTTVQIDKGVGTIVAYSFKNMTNLTTVTWTGTGNSQHIVNIGDGAFEGCTSLTSFVLPGNTSTLQTVGKNAFSGCSSLTTVDLKKSDNVSFGPGAFDGCSSLTTFNYNGSNGPDVTNLPPTVMGDHALCLSDMIGVMFHISIPACIEDPSTVSVKFTVGPDDTGATFNRYDTVTASIADTNAPAAVQDRERFFNCEINPLEMGDTITAHILVNGEEVGTAKSYTAIDAINAYKDKYGTTTGGTIYPLVDALHAYGYYIYLAKDEINDGFDHAPISGEGLNQTVDPDIVLGLLQTRQEDKGDVELKFIVDSGNVSKTSINLNLYAKTNLKVMINGNADEIKECGDIGPAALDDPKEFEFADGTKLQASVMSYVMRSLKNSKNSDDKKTAIAALYYYNVTAKAYNPLNP